MLLPNQGNGGIGSLDCFLHKLSNLAKFEHLAIIFCH